MLSAVCSGVTTSLVLTRTAENKVKLTAVNYEHSGCKRVYVTIAIYFLAIIGIYMYYTA